MKKKNIIIISSICILILLLLIILIPKNKLTNLEKVKINEMNDEIINYIDEIYEYDDEGKYINFAIEYLYNEKDKKEYSDEDIVNTLNNIFSKKCTIDDIKKIGISKRMADKGISYNIDKFEYNTNLTKKEISTKVLYKYSINKIKKINSKKFVVKYNRFIVSNPYDILNYYEKKNIDSKDIYDTSNINKYLNGQGKIKLIKEAINKDNAKAEGNIEITYIIKDKQLLIDNIK